MVKDGGDEVATVEVKTVVVSHADNGSVRTKYVHSGWRQEGNRPSAHIGWGRHPSVPTCLESGVDKTSRGSGCGPHQACGPNAANPRHK